MARDFYLERPDRDERQCAGVQPWPPNGTFVHSWQTCRLRAGHSGGHDFTAPQPNVANGDGDLKGWTLLTLIAIAVLVGVLVSGCLGAFG